MLKRCLMPLMLMFAVSCLEAGGPEDDVGGSADGHTSGIYFTVTNGPTAVHRTAGGDLRIAQILEHVRSRLHGDPAAAALALPSALSADDDMTVSECRAQSSAFSGQGYGKTRFVSCQAHGLHFIKVDCWFWIINCRVTAAADVDVTDIQYTQNNGRVVDVVQLFNNWWTWGNAEELTLNANVTCSPKNSSGPCTPGFFRGPYVQSVAAWAAEGDFTAKVYDFNQPASSGWGPDQISYGAINWHFAVPGAEQPPANGPDSQFRCDSASYLVGNAGEGCVFPWVTETMNFYVSQSGEVANHILNALYHPEETIPDKPGKVIPGRPGTQPLHRTTDPAQINAHRSLAVATCQLYWPNYAQEGLECDEFPFATTLEGASPDDNFSVEPVPARDNQSGGGVESAFYTYRRIIGDDVDHINDPFFVDVHP